MEIPHMDGKKKGVNKALVTTMSILIVILFALATLTGMQAYSVGNNIKAHWSEIVFAYEHPTIVKLIRTDYEKKVSQVDSSYGAVKQQTPEEKLLNAVSDQLHSSK